MTIHLVTEIYHTATSVAMCHAHEHAVNFTPKSIYNQNRNNIYTLHRHKQNVHYNIRLEHQQSYRRSDCNNDALL